MTEPLGTDEFVRWTTHFDNRLDRIDDAMTAHDTKTTANAVDIAVLKAQQAKAVGKHGTIATIVAGVVAGLVSYFSGGAK